LVLKPNNIWFYIFLLFGFKTKLANKLGFKNGRPFYTQFWLSAKKKLGFIPNQIKPNLFGFKPNDENASVQSAGS